MDSLQPVPALTEEREMAGTETTLIAMLQAALERQTAASERMAADIPREIQRLRTDVQETMATTMAKTLRMVIAMAIICMAMMAGLVGTQIVIAKDGLTVNAEPQTEPE